MMLIYGFPKNIDEWKEELMKDYNFTLLYKGKRLLQKDILGGVDNLEDITNHSLFSVDYEIGMLRRVN